MLTSGRRFARLRKTLAIGGLSVTLMAAGATSQAAFAAPSDDAAALAAADAAWAQAKARIDQLPTVQAPPKSASRMQAAAAAVNGCGPAGWKGKLVPDTYGYANFNPACNWHDACYAPGSRLARATCDTTFRNQLYTECDRAYPKVPSPPGRDGNANCKNAANIYYTAVRKFGAQYYKGEGNNA